MLREPNKILYLIWTEEMGHCEKHRVLILCKTAGQNDCAALEDTTTCCQHHFAESILTRWGWRKWQNVPRWLRLIERGLEGEKYWAQGRINELMTEREREEKGVMRQRVTEKQRGERRKCRRACFYGRSGKIWGEGILHHHGRPMKRLG